jgi:stage II sporulation protein D
MFAPAAQAASTFTVRGAGFGHGVGMSQYGAYGFALKGSMYRQILAHYYTGTGLGVSGDRTVRVLVGSGSRFTGATRAGGRRVRPGSTYSARARGGAVDLLSSTGRRLATVAAPLRVTTSGLLTLEGRAYRGALEFRPAGKGVNAINALPLDEYVQGVVALESPSHWPAEALKAQAVAARTYALTTSKSGDGFDQYADVRSQVYGGVGAETPSTNAAVQATRGEVVTYDGVPVTTFFFSTSGGRTEAVENTSLGSRPLPWLKSVADPHDDVSPRHRWGPIRMSLARADRRLGRLVKGAFRGVEVVSRGVSPRIVAADVVGTRGRTRVTGAQLRARLGLLDTWAYFTTIATEETPEPEPLSRRARAAGLRPARDAVSGTVVGRRGTAVLEIATQVGWRTAGTARIRRNGSYRFGLCAKGRYRVKVGRATGPVVTVR